MSSEIVATRNMIDLTMGPDRDEIMIETVTPHTTNVVARIGVTRPRLEAIIMLVMDQEVVIVMGAVGRGGIMGHGAGIQKTTAGGADHAVHSSIELMEDRMGDSPIHHGALRLIDREECQKVATVLEKTNSVVTFALRQKNPNKILVQLTPDGLLDINHQSRNQNHRMMITREAPEIVGPTHPPSRNSHPSQDLLQ